MATDYVSGSTERERRELVANMAARGRRAAQARDTTTEVSRNYADEAAALFANQPAIELAPEQELQLASGTEGMADDAARYAAAVYDIFNRGRGRETDTMNQALGEDQDVLTEATNYRLGRYADELAAMDAAGISPRRRRGPTGPTDTGYQFGEDEEFDFIDIPGPPPPDFISPTIAAGYGVPDFNPQVQAVNAIFAEIAADPTADIGDAQREARLALEETGLGNQVIDLILAEAVNRWADFYTQEESRGRFEAGTRRGRQASPDPWTFR